MENTLVIMQYHDEIMSDILDNLIVWDWQRRVHHENCIKYKKEKFSNGWKNGPYFIFTITAIKEPFLVFYTIGEQVEKRINKPIRYLGPQPCP